jgi:hypothetical protein
MWMRGRQTFLPYKIAWKVDILVRQIFWMGNFFLVLICLFFSFIVVLDGVTLCHLQRFLQCINYIILEFTPSTTLLYFLSPIHETVSVGIIFAFTYTCSTHLFYLIDSPTTFPHLVLPGQDRFGHPVSWMGIFLDSHNMDIFRLA